jgi:predicted RNase H-like HicB family nuclease
VYFLPDRRAGGYTAPIPALGIVTEGETLAEAEDMARDAVEGYLEAARELGKSIPRDVKDGGACMKLPALMPGATKPIRSWRIREDWSCPGATEMLQLDLPKDWHGS